MLDMNWGVYRSGWSGIPDIETPIYIQHHLLTDQPYHTTRLKQHQLLPLQPYLDHQTKQQDDMNYTILILIYGGQDDTDIMMTWPLQCDY